MAQSRVVLVDGMQFVGTADSGHAVIMDAPASAGGGNTGQTPMELLLSAFAGCSGMDVISIMRKKKQNVNRLEVQVEGEKAHGHPKIYTALHIKYTVAGKGISEDALKSAIDLSLKKYCSVGAMLGASAKISHSFTVIER